MPSFYKPFVWSSSPLVKPYDEAIKIKKDKYCVLGHNVGRNLLLARLSNLVNFHEEFCWLKVLYTKAKHLPAEDVNEEQFAQDVSSLNK